MKRLGNKINTLIDKIFIDSDIEYDIDHKVLQIKGSIGIKDFTFLVDGILTDFERQIVQDKCIKFKFKKQTTCYIQLTKNLEQNLYNSQQKNELIHLNGLLDQLEDNLNKLCLSIEEVIHND